MRMINESKEKKKNPEKTPRSASAVMRRRAAVSMTVLVVMGAAVAGKLFKVSIVDNSKYETLANNYHFGTMTLDANRGAIYDANGTALAALAMPEGWYPGESLRAVRIAPPEGKENAS